MEQLVFAGNAYLKINSLVKTPLHEFMAVERSGLWAPDIGSFHAISGDTNNNGEMNKCWWTNKAS